MNSYILWTGGWDSTFRMLQLLECDNIKISPIYIIDKKRCSHKIEIEIIENLMKRFRWLTKNEINDIKFYDSAFVEKNIKNDFIDKSYSHFYSNFNIGIQYKWFSLLLEYLNINCEIGIHLGGKCEKAINSVKCESLKNTMFRRYKLPLIRYTKLDMKMYAESKGWMEIMNKTWFCFNPINGSPCGCCNPCKDAMTMGMQWRMPFMSKLKYYFYNIIK